MVPINLRNSVSEFVTREWNEFCSSSDTLDDKIDLVIGQPQYN